MVPVYDYVLATEPLSESQLESIGWKGRQGLSDSTNQFHYYRLTDDNRIIWGGYDAVYYFNNKVAPSLEQRPETFALLSKHFFGDIPPARRPGIQPRVGWRDRHQHPVHGVLGQGDGGQGGLCDGLHRPGCRRHSLRPEPCSICSTTATARWSASIS